MLRAVAGQKRAALLIAALLWNANPATAGPGVCGGVAPDTPDIDGDCVPDYVDNCIFVPNAAPADCDTDGDGYGNACDGDFDNSGVVNATDFTDIFVPAFNTGVVSPTGTDMDCGGVVNATDFTSYFVPQFDRGVPGPSCCAP